MAAGILGGMEGRLGVRGWRWWVFSTSMDVVLTPFDPTGCSISKSVVMQVLFRRFNCLQGSCIYLRRTSGSVSVLLNEIQLKFRYMLTQIHVGGFYRIM